MATMGVGVDGFGMEAMYGTVATKRMKAAFKLAINPTMRRLIRDGE